MPDVLPFPVPRPRIASGCLLMVMLVHEEQIRRWTIQAEPGGRAARGEIWFGRARHDHKRAVGALEIGRLLRQFEAEIADYRQMGWREE